MEKKPVLILGSGHLAYRVRVLAESRGYRVVHVEAGAFHFKSDNSPAFERIERVLKTAAGNNLSSFAMTYLLDDRDDYNFELLIALMSLDKNLPIIASLFNENIAPHLRAAHPRLQILNPAKIAAPVFIEALGTPVERFLRYKPLPASDDPKPRARGDYFIEALVISFMALVCIATVYFHVAEGQSWINALYFVIVTVSTVGYGDINLLNSATASKIADIVLILGATVFIWMIFSLTIDRIIKKRSQLALGRKKYSYTNHIIICGLGRLGYFIADELVRRGEKIIIIEKDEDSPNAVYFRNHGVDVYTADARSPRVLDNAGVAGARALISIISDDYVNLEIGLNARSFQPDLRLILRIFDESMARKIKENLDIHLTLSMSAIADEKFLAPLDPLPSAK